MFLKKGKNLIFLSFLLIFLISPLLVLAWHLEIEYPEILGRKITPQSELSEVVQYFYYFLIVIGGFIAVGVLIFAGVKWLASAGNPTAISESQKWIFGAFFGLTVLFSSWIILSTINPSLVELPALEPEPGEPVTPDVPKIDDGYILYFDDEEFPFLEVPYGDLGVDDTKKFPVNGKKDLYKKITKIEFKNTGSHQYGVIFFEKTGRSGKCQVVTEDTNDIIDSRSIRSFTMPAPPGHHLSDSIYLPEEKITVNGESVVFFQVEYPNRIKVDPKSGDTKLRGSYREYSLQNIKSGIKKVEELPEKGDRVQRWTWGNNMPRSLKMVLAGGKERVGKYLLVLNNSDKWGNGDCYDTQESIDDFRDLYWGWGGVFSKQPDSFQAFQVLRVSQ